MHIKGSRQLAWTTCLKCISVQTFSQCSNVHGSLLVQMLRYSNARMELQSPRRLIQATGVDCRNGSATLSSQILSTFVLALPSDKKEMWCLYSLPPSYTKSSLQSDLRGESQIESHQLCDFKFCSRGVLEQKRMLALLILWRRCVGRKMDVLAFSVILNVVLPLSH